MKTETTLIHASYMIAFDGKKHRILKDAELAFRGPDIIFLGKKYQGPVDKKIDATRKIVSPGFISTHAHLYESPLDRSFIEDRGNPQFFLSGLYEYLPARRLAMDQEIGRICLEYSLAELLRNGTTTVVEIGPYGKELVSLVPTFGNRVYCGQPYRSGKWVTYDGKQVLYEWFEDEGLGSLEQAAEFIQKYDGVSNGLIRGMLCPLQVDTCKEGLLRKSQEWAQKLNVPLSIHVSQAVNEFHEMLRRHGKTPVAWLKDIGFLQQNVILGHSIIIGGTSWSNYPPGDLDIIAKSGCSVAHAPWVFARRGMVMESFYKYQRAGINMALGTDTSSQNMIHAMRWAAVLSKIVERNTESTTAADVFNAATLGGAKALGREDLGRLCVGAKADIVVISGEGMNMVPLRDPVKNIVYSAESEDVQTVIINGNIVLENGKLVGKDETLLNRELQEAGTRVWPNIKNYDWAHRTVDELSPLSFDLWEL